MFSPKKTCFHQNKTCLPQLKHVFIKPMFSPKRFVHQTSCFHQKVRFLQKTYLHQKNVCTKKKRFHQETYVHNKKYFHQKKNVCLKTILPKNHHISKTHVFTIIKYYKKNMFSLKKTIKNMFSQKKCM